MSKKLYWQGEHPLGGGKNRLTMGDTLPERMYIDTGEDGWEPDPRLEGWMEDKTVSDEAVVNFSRQKQNELEAAGEKIIILRDEIEKLKDELSAAAKVAKNGKGTAASKKEVKDLKEEIKNLKSDAATAKTATDKAMADEKVESGDVIAGLQLEIEDLKKKVPKTETDKASGPKS